jgi:hypothetical protein
MILETIAIAFKSISKSKPLKRRKHFENDQDTYQVSMNIQFGISANPTHRVISKATTRFQNLEWYT